MIYKKHFYSACILSILLILTACNFPDTNSLDPTPENTEVVPTNTSAPINAETPAPLIEPTVVPGSITGFVFIDANNNGIRDAGEDSTGISGAHLTLMAGSCPGTSLISETWSNSPDGLYGFGMLMPGDYCILTDPLQQTILPEALDFSISNDQHLVDINFYMPMPYSHTPTPTVIPSNPPTPTIVSNNNEITVAVYVWKDNNADGIWDLNEDSFNNVRVYLGSGTCDDRASGSLTELTSGFGEAVFNYTGEIPRCAYVEMPQTCGAFSIPTTDTEWTIIANSGDIIIIKIGYAPYVC